MKDAASEFAKGERKDASAAQAVRKNSGTWARLKITLKTGVPVDWIAAVVWSSVSVIAFLFRPRLLGTQFGGA